MARRGATDYSGILAIDKPAGMTSHDVVSAVRRTTGEKRVGHAGTLDPLATGVLVVLVGPATRLAAYLTAAEKTYDARVVFGAETDTDDTEGEVTRTAAVPQELATETGAIAHVADLVGTHNQVPPAFSAIKRNGVTAHRAAREGKPLELDARTITVTDALLLGVEPGPPIAWNLSLRVSKGTYIRAIARDLGRELGTAAHLGSLRRVNSGDIDIARCHSLATITDPETDTASLFTPATTVLGLHVIEIDNATARAVAVGMALPLTPDVAQGSTVALAHSGRLSALYTRTEAGLTPAVVIPGGVT